MHMRHVRMRRYAHMHLQRFADAMRVHALDGGAAGGGALAAADTGGAFATAAALVRLFGALCGAACARGTPLSAWLRDPLTPEAAALRAFLNALLALLPPLAPRHNGAAILSPRSYPRPLPRPQPRPTSTRNLPPLPPRPPTGPVLARRAVTRCARGPRAVRARRPERPAALGR